MWGRRKPLPRWRVIYADPGDPAAKRISEPRAESAEAAHADMDAREAEYAAATGTPKYVFVSVERI